MSAHTVQSASTVHPPLLLGLTLISVMGRPGQPPNACSGASYPACILPCIVELTTYAVFQGDTAVSTSFMTT